jgi:hypothetical protein
MILFVHLGKQIDGTTDFFSFFSTLKDAFVSIGGDQIFSSVEDLQYAFEVSNFTAEQKAKVLGALPHHLKALHGNEEIAPKKRGKRK